MVFSDGIVPPRPHRRRRRVQRPAAPRRDISMDPVHSGASATGREKVSVPAHIRPVSSTVRSAGKAPSCSMIPIRGRTRRRSRWGSRPSTRTTPEAGPVNPSSTSRIEVFPAPLVPSSANSSPRRTEKVTPRTASNPVRPGGP
jgi:hypothetical protein